MHKHRCIIDLLVCFSSVQHVIVCVPVYSMSLYVCQCTACHCMCASVQHVIVCVPVCSMSLYVCQCTACHCMCASVQHVIVCVPVCSMSLYVCQCAACHCMCASVQHVIVCVPVYSMSCRSVMSFPETIYPPLILTSSTEGDSLNRYLLNLRE